jgi:hypothetical protein
MGRPAGLSPARALYGLRDRGGGFGLSDDARLQLVCHAQQASALVGGELRDGNMHPFGNHGRHRFRRNQAAAVRGGFIG